MSKSIIPISPQTKASLVYLSNIADTDTDKLLDLLEDTSELRLRGLLAAAVIRDSIRRNAPPETDRQRGDLRESLVKEIDRQILIMQLDAKESAESGNLYIAEAKNNRAYGLRMATGIIRESSHLF